MKGRRLQWLWLGLLGLLLAGASGCASRARNASVRPWDAPQAWESGLPMGLDQQQLQH